MYRSITHFFATRHSHHCFVFSCVIIESQIKYGKSIQFVVILCVLLKCPLLHDNNNNWMSRAIDHARTRKILNLSHDFKFINISIQ